MKGVLIKTAVASVATMGLIMVIGIIGKPEPRDPEMQRRNRKKINAVLKSKTPEEYREMIKEV